MVIIIFVWSKGIMNESTLHPFFHSPSFKSNPLILSCSPFKSRLLLMHVRSRHNPVNTFSKLIVGCFSFTRQSSKSLTWYVVPTSIISLPSHHFLPHCFYFRNKKIMHFFSLCHFLCFFPLECLSLVPIFTFHWTAWWFFPWRNFSFLVSNWVGWLPSLLPCNPCPKACNTEYWIDLVHVLSPHYIVIAKICGKGSVLIRCQVDCEHGIAYFKLN